jgi:hypothetical protein
MDSRARPYSEELSTLIFQYVHRVVELVPATSVGALDCWLDADEQQRAIALETLRRSIGDDAEIVRWPDGHFSAVLPGVTYADTIAAAERARDAVASSGYLHACGGLRVGLSWCIPRADPHLLLEGVRTALADARETGASIVVAADAPLETPRGA